MLIGTLRRGAIALGVVLPTMLTAQGAASLQLQPASARLAEEFTEVTAVRELPDGRVIVTDRRDARLVVADFRRNRVAPIGRRGQGPGEYARPQAVWAVAKDSSVMVDGAQRWLMFDGPRIVATLGAAVRAVAVTRPTVRGADTLGHIYRAGTIAGQDGSLGDSTVLLRVKRGSGQVDTITRLRAVVPRQTSAPDEKGFFSFSMPVVQSAEEALAFADGSVAVARLEPYRVDWQSADGRWTFGAPIPVTRVAMNDREKRAYLERIARTTGRPAPALEAVSDWPKEVPPWQSPNALMAAPDGRLVIPRLATASHGEPRYDLVNRRGALDGQLVLSASERLVGFGPSSAYVAEIDDDGIERLRRHPWPPLPAR